MTKIIWCLVLPALLVAAMYAWGHDPSGHHSYTDWYVTQKQEGVPVPCCGDIDKNGGDAHFLDNDDIKQVGGKYMVRIDGNWMEYPKPVNPNYYNPTGHNIIWYNRMDGGYIFYCLRLETMT